MKGCIYCGSSAETREHVPSKVFLDKPFPENLPTIPACFRCNNDYSSDENYVACFLDVLKESLYKDYKMRENTVKRLEKDHALKTLIDLNIKKDDGKVFFDIDENRLLRILKKLARGHAGFELDYVDFNDTEMEVNYDFRFNLSIEELNEFNQISVSQVCPEIGSRGLLIIQNFESAEALAFAGWHDIQDKYYRYQVGYNDNNDICVKMEIYEFLFCKVNFK